MTAAIAASMTTGAWAVQEAEADLGSVTGRITDSEKRVLPGASVIVEDLHTGVTTDINGYYKLPVLKPGTYTLKISYVGYAPITRKITVTDKKSQVNNFVMSEGHELKEIEVQGALSEQRRALQMQKSGMGLTNVVSADQAGKFPDSNIGDALKRISGINVQYDQGEARFGQVRGTSADLTSVTINGNRIPSGRRRHPQRATRPHTIRHDSDHRGKQGRHLRHGRRCDRRRDKPRDKEHAVPPSAQLHGGHRLQLD